MAAARPVSADPAAQGSYDAGVVARAIAAPRAFRQFARSGAALEQVFPDELVWYLQALGVHPDAQRRGVGAALLSAGLAVVDADHAACHLHTSDPLNVEHYRRWGFQLTTCVPGRGRRADVLRDDPPSIRTPLVMHMALTRYRTFLSRPAPNLGPTRTAANLITSGRDDVRVRLLALEG